MRIGLIGCGRHAMASVLPAFPGAGLRLVATCARHIERARTCAELFGAPMAFDDPSAMIDAGGLDGVVIAVPADAYVPLIDLCMVARLPVFAEKPGAASGAQARRIAEVSETGGVPVMVGYMKRFAPAYRCARDLINDASFGRPTLASLRFVVGSGFGGSLQTWVMDNLVHPLDMARFLVGELSEMSGLHTHEPEAGHALAMIARSERGAVVTFEFATTGSWVQHNERVEVTGVGATVCVDNVDTCVYRPREGAEQIWKPNYTVPVPANTTPVVAGFVGELEHFHRVVADGAPCDSDIRSAARTLETAEELLAAALDV